jgi:hypothetical protein
VVSVIKYPVCSEKEVGYYYVALHASHAALPMVMLEILYCTSDSKCGDLALQVGGVSDETVK